MMYIYLTVKEYMIVW